MKNISGREFARILEKKGWKLKRINGSHYIYVKEGSPTRISIPIHANRPLKTGLLQHLMKIAEIDNKEV